MEWRPGASRGCGRGRVWLRPPREGSPMTPQPVSALSAPARRPPFDAVTIAFHWTTLAGVLGLFTAALLIDHAPDPATAGLLLTTHRSLGVTVWTLTVLRLSWRLT